MFRNFRGIPNQLQATFVLICINIIVFMVTTTKGGTAEVLVQYGALFKPLVLFRHEYWRLFTAMFLHADVMHLLVNMYSLFIVGSLLEPIFGKHRFLFIYMLSGLLGSVLSFSLGNIFSISVGASGAIFGLFMSVVLLHRFFPYHTGIRLQSQSFLSTILINLVFSFAPGIDMWAHIGGLLGGFLATMTLKFQSRDRVKQGMILLLYIIIVATLILFGRK
ncbi:rhomboid family intramembrane serine protease [Carnobacteriaceae bacterium zg-ZUI78]|nr:rhomboid family intramembrane serine protease [Carnobacteriaceae bacterium zg-ZUI78]